MDLHEIPCYPDGVADAVKCDTRGTIERIASTRDGVLIILETLPRVPHFMHHIQTHASCLHLHIKHTLLWGHHNRAYTQIALLPRAWGEIAETLWGRGVIIHGDSIINRFACLKMSHSPKDMRPRGAITKGHLTQIAKYMI